GSPGCQPGCRLRLQATSGDGLSRGLRTGDGRIHVHGEYRYVSAAGPGFDRFDAAGPLHPSNPSALSSCEGIAGAEKSYLQRLIQRITMQRISILLSFLVLALRPSAQEINKFEQLGNLLPTPNSTRAASGAPGKAYWQQKADYTMQ